MAISHAVSGQATGHDVRTLARDALSVQTRQLKARAQVCKACGNERAQHARIHEHCKVCADVCRRCEDACMNLLGSLG